MLTQAPPQACGPTSSLTQAATPKSPCPPSFPVEEPSGGPLPLPSLPALTQPTRPRPSPPGPAGPLQAAPRTAAALLRLWPDSEHTSVGSCQGPLSGSPLGLCLSGSFYVSFCLVLSLSLQCLSCVHLSLAPPPCLSLCLCLSVAPTHMGDALYLLSSFVRLYQHVCWGRGYMWGSIRLCWGRGFLFCCLAPACSCGLPLQVRVSVGLSFSPSRSSSLSSSRKLRKKEEATLLEADWLLVTSLFSRERAKITEYFWSRAVLPSPA